MEPQGTKKTHSTLLLQPSKVLKGEEKITVKILKANSPDKINAGSKRDNHLNCTYSYEHE